MVYVHGNGNKYIFEANYGSAKEKQADGTFEKKKFDGACLVDLRHKIYDYKHGRTDVAVRQLPKGTFDGEKGQKLREAFHHCINHKFADVPFDHDLKRGFKAIFDCCPCCESSEETLHGEHGKIHAMFCSEIIASVYQTVGLMKGPMNLTGGDDLKAGPPPSEYVPRDFASEPGCNVELDFIKEIGFGPMLWFDRQDKGWCTSEEWCNLSEDFPCCTCDDGDSALSHCCHICCPCAYYKDYCITVADDKYGPTAAGVSPHLDLLALKKIKCSHEDCSDSEGDKGLNLCRSASALEAPKLVQGSANADK